MAKSSTSGIGVTGLLGVVFVTLKLCGVIDWSWWLVTLPFWGGLVIAILMVLIMGAYLSGKKSSQDDVWTHKPSRWRERLEELKAEQEKTKTSK